MAAPRGSPVNSVKDSRVADQKIFAGPRIRRIRSAKGLTQTAMAEGLGDHDWSDLVTAAERLGNVELKWNA